MSPTAYMSQRGSSSKDLSPLTSRPQFCFPAHQALHPQKHLCNHRSTALRSQFLGMLDDFLKLFYHPRSTYLQNANTSKKGTLSSSTEIMLHVNQLLLSLLLNVIHISLAAPAEENIYYKQESLGDSLPSLMSAPSLWTDCLQHIDFCLLFTIERWSFNGPVPWFFHEKVLGENTTTCTI